MATVNLCCPQQWDGPSAIDFVNECDAAAGSVEIRINFKGVEFVKPFGTLLIGSAIRNLVANLRANSGKVSATVPRGDENAIGYLRHIGFFHYIGLETGRQPGAANGSSRYVPIHTITMGDLENAACGGVFQKGVDAVTEHLADVIYPHLMEQIMMQYCLREIVRNVFEHAETDRCTVLAQRYSNGWAEIAIVDEGIGIYGSLKQNLAVQSVDAALAMAIKPGISRVAHAQNRGEWDNSGFGLYVLSELGRELGEFTLASNGRYIQLHRHVASARFDRVQISGTAIKLLVDLEEAEYFPNRLHLLVQRGEMSHYEETGVAKTASKRSKMVSGESC